MAQNFKKSLTVNVYFQNMKRFDMHLLLKCCSKASQDGLSHFQSLERLDSQKLPDIKEFHNSLGFEDTVCSMEDYKYAQRVWEFFQCGTMRDYHDLKCDTALTADCFEHFRDFCMSDYGIDPSQYMGAPGLFWDAALKMTSAGLDQITDLEMMLMFEAGKRGGPCFVNSRLAKANNKDLPDQDPSRPSSYILYTDMTALYAGCMSQPLPTGNFRREKPSSFKKIAALRATSTDKRGYLLEVDVVAPSCIHSTEADFPALCQKRVVKFEDMPPPSKHDVKFIERPRLMNHLWPAKDLVVSLPQLILLLDRGYQLKKVSRCISFDQRPWLKPYIEHNALARDKAKGRKDDFLVDFYKLASNAVFGKSMEDVRLYSDYRLVTRDKDVDTILNGQRYNGYHMINDRLAGFPLKQLCVKLTKPLYVGVFVLDLAKVHLQRHLERMQRHFGARSKLLYTDTDSLILQIFSEDVFEELNSQAICDEFDFTKSKRCHSSVLSGAVGKMKIEPAADCHLKRFVGVAPKVYAIDVQYSPEALEPPEPRVVHPYRRKKEWTPPSEIKLANKGFRMAETRASMKVYETCILTGKPHDLTHTYIQARRHQLYKEIQKKKGPASSWGCKRYPKLPDLESMTFDSLPFGHKDLVYIHHDASSDRHSGT